MPTNRIRSPYCAEKGMCFPCYRPKVKVLLQLGRQELGWSPLCIPCLQQLNNPEHVVETHRRFISCVFLEKPVLSPMGKSPSSPFRMVWTSTVGLWEGFASRIANRGTGPLQEVKICKTHDCQASPRDTRNRFLTRSF